MGRTKRQKTATEERKLQEHDWWCFYCGEDFDDEYALREHQEAQHFTCTVCQARNTTPLELRVHSREEHQLDVLRVNNTLAGRDWVDLGVVGMDGMPDAFLGTFSSGAKVTVAHCVRAGSWLWIRMAVRPSSSSNSPSRKCPRSPVGSAAPSSDRTMQLVRFAPVPGTGSGWLPGSPPR